MKPGQAICSFFVLIRMNMRVNPIELAKNKPPPSYSDFPLLRDSPDFLSRPCMSQTQIRALCEKAKLVPQQPAKGNEINWKCTEAGEYRASKRMAVACILSRKSLKLRYS
jgi:hypothetical protein